MPNKKPSEQDVSDCHRRKLGLASVVKVEQYPEITLAIQRSAEVLHSGTSEHVMLRFCGHEGQPLCVGMFGLRHTYARETVDVNKRERLSYGRRSSSATAILRCYGGYKPGMSVRRQEAKHPSALVHRPWSVKPPLDHNRARC